MKLKEFQAYLKQQKIDLALLVHPDINIVYFTRMKLSYGHLVISPSSAFFYVTELDKKPMLSEIVVKYFKKGWEKDVHPKKVRKIGINKESLTIASKERLRKIFPDASFVDLSLVLKKLRTEKTVFELGCIRKACDITTSAFDSLITQFKKSISFFKTEQDVLFFLEKKIKQQGGDIAFPTIVANGKNAAVPHHVTSHAQLVKGFIVVDFGASFNFYCADMTRTIYFGSPSKEERVLYELLLKSQEAAVNAVALNRPLLELNKISRKILGKYSSYFIHSLGHGIGLEVHEAPSFHSEDKPVVRENVPFTIEPGIYFPNKYGIRIEDTLYFDGREVVILTKASKELICMEN